jgi:hypothetical protein
MFEMFERPLCGTFMLVNTSATPKPKLRIAMLIVAIPLGLLSQFTVDAEYKIVQVPAVKGTATREVPLGSCYVRTRFFLGSQLFIRGDILSNSQCRTKFLTSSNPTMYVEATTISEEYQTVIEASKQVEKRQWGSEILSRLVRFLVGALVGLTLVGAVKVVYLKRLRMLSASTRVLATITKMTGGAGNSPVAGSRLDAPPQTSPMAVPVAPAPKNYFDPHFNRFVSPTVISILYVLLNLSGLFFVVFYWLGEVGTVSSNEESVALFMLWSIPLAIAGMVVLWLIIRLICESAIVLFRVAEDLRQIRNRQGQ